MSATSARRVKPQVAERLIVVGGQCSGVGKTALVVDIVRAMPEMQWTAVKITPHLGERGPRKAVAERNSFSICDELDAAGRSDTSRFLAAGAKRALWVQTKPGALREALPSLRRAIGGSRNVMVESDAIVQFWKPDLYLMVVDPSFDDFKDSARRLISAVDVFVYRSRLGGARNKDWPIHRRTARPGSCTVLQPLGEPLPQKLQEILRQPGRRS